MTKGESKYFNEFIKKLSDEAKDCPEGKEDVYITALGAALADESRKNPFLGSSIITASTLLLAADAENSGTVYNEFCKILFSAVKKAGKTIPTNILNIILTDIDDSGAYFTLCGAHENPELICTALLTCSDVDENIKQAILKCAEILKENGANQM